MKAICEKHGALFILDEIMSGMGRCGTLHAWEQEDVVPDIQTIGKGLGGGYAPVSGVLIGDSIVQTMDKGTGVFRHGQTYQGHPISCAAALAVQKTIQEQSLLERVREMGAYLESRLRQQLEDHPHVGDIRGKGLFWGVSLLYHFNGQADLCNRLNLSRTRQLRNHSTLLRAYLSCSRRRVCSLSTLSRSMAALGL